MFNLSGILICGIPLDSITQDNAPIIENTPDCRAFTQDVSTLSNARLIKLHGLIEESFSGYLDGFNFSDLDDELNYRVEDGQLDWPYDSEGRS